MKITKKRFIHSRLDKWKSLESLILNIKPDMESIENPKQRIRHENTRNEPTFVPVFESSFLCVVCVIFLFSKFLNPDFVFVQLASSGSFVCEISGKSCARKNAPFEGSISLPACLYPDLRSRRLIDLRYERAHLRRNG